MYNYVDLSNVSKNVIKNNNAIEKYYFILLKIQVSFFKIHKL